LASFVACVMPITISQDDSFVTVGALPSFRFDGSLRAGRSFADCGLRNLTTLIGRKSAHDNCEG